MAEQLSVLSKDNVVTAEELKQYFSEITENRLPALVQNGSTSHSGGDQFSERDILYKLFFDMKKDLNDLKKFIFEMAQRQDLDLSKFPDNELVSRQASGELKGFESDKPIIIESPKPYHEDVEEESLSIADKEKELIEKALKKHKGKRKNAALDLGISERTLYRKIKEYKINE